MKFAVIISALTCLPVLVAAPCQAHEYPAGAIAVSHPWARATQPVGMDAGGYLTITNIGNKTDRLVSVQSSWAIKVEIHQPDDEAGTGATPPLAGTLDLAPGQSVALQPGGPHFMFIKPGRALVEGDRIPASLTFEQAGVIEVGFLVQGADRQAPVDKPRVAPQSSGN